MSTYYKGFEIRHCPSTVNKNEYHVHFLSGLLLIECKSIRASKLAITHYLKHWGHHE